MNKHDKSIQAKLTQAENTRFTQLLFREHQLNELAGTIALVNAGLRRVGLPKVHGNAKHLKKAAQ